MKYLSILKFNIYEKNSFCYYKYRNIKKSFFLKTLNKKIKNIEKKSFYRDKNITFLKKFFNNSVFNGKKEFFLKNFNNFIKVFNFLFLKKDNDFIFYKNYENIFNLINNSYKYYNFEMLLNEFIFIFEIMFNIKVIEIIKKRKNKLKKLLDYEAQYIPKEKRLKLFIKSLILYSKNIKNFNISNKIFFLFVEILFNPYNSFIWKRKVYIYKKILKKYHNKQIFNYE